MGEYMSTIKKNDEGSLPPIIKLENSNINKIESYTFKKNLLSQHH